MVCWGFDGAISMREIEREKRKPFCCYHIRVLSVNTHSAHFQLKFSPKRKGKESCCSFLYVYFRLRSTSAATITAITITAAAAAISKVSVEVLLGLSTTAVADAWSTPTAVVALDP